jgi:hypothetical protein
VGYFLGSGLEQWADGLALIEIRGVGLYCLDPGSGFGSGLGFVDLMERYFEMKKG